MAGHFPAFQGLGYDADEHVGIGAADITKLKANGYYTVAVMTCPHLFSRHWAVAETYLGLVRSFCNPQNTSESQGLQRS